MRWIIGILLVGNLLVLLWQGFIVPPDRTHGHALPPPDVGNLRLISERSVGDARIERPPAVMSPLSDEWTRPTPTTPEPVPVPPVALTEAQPVAAPVATPAQEGGSTSLASPPEPVQAPEEKTEAPAQQAGAVGLEGPATAQAVGQSETRASPEQPVPPAESPEVASESVVATPEPKGQPVGSDSKTAAAQPADREVAETQAPVEDSRLCWELGNFAERAQAESAADELPPGLALVTIADRELTRVTGYYVLVPAVPDRQEARATEARLKEKGFGDTWRFRSGPLENAISLGLFNRQRNAEQHATRIRAEGFDVVLREKTRAVPVFRLKVQGRDTETHSRIMRRLGAGNVEQVECP